MDTLIALLARLDLRVPIRRFPQTRAHLARLLARIPYSAHHVWPGLRAPTLPLSHCPALKGRTVSMLLPTVLIARPAFLVQLEMFYQLLACLEATV